MRNRIMITYMLLLVAALTIIFVPVAEVSAFWVNNLEVSASSSSTTIILDGWNRDGGIIDFEEIPLFRDLPYIFGRYDRDGNINLDEAGNPRNGYVPIGTLFRMGEEGEELRIVFHSHHYTRVHYSYSSHRVCRELEFEYGIRYQPGSIVTYPDPVTNEIRWFRARCDLSWYPGYVIQLDWAGRWIAGWDWLEIHPVDMSTFSYFPGTTVLDLTLRLDQVIDRHIHLTLEFDSRIRYRPGSIVTHPDPVTNETRWFRARCNLDSHPTYVIQYQDWAGGWIAGWDWLEIHPVDMGIFGYLPGTTLLDLTLRLDQVIDRRLPLP